MDIVEQKLAGLESLPARMTALELQILHLRDEMRAEFSAIRSEFLASDEAMATGLREETRAINEETRRVLRDEIRAGDEETRRVLREEIAALGVHMRVLHEDVISRLALIQEGQTRGRRPRRH
jgi:hypothetical protein